MHAPRGPKQHSAPSAQGRQSAPGGPDHADLLSLLLSAKGLARLATGDLATAALTLTDAVSACAGRGSVPEQLTKAQTHPPVAGGADDC